MNKREVILHILVGLNKNVPKNINFGSRAGDVAGSSGGAFFKIARIVGI